MAEAIRFTQLTSARQELVRLCQSINYGGIQSLEVRHGEPCLTDPGPSVLVDVRLDSEELTRDESSLVDFVLCAEVRRLMSLLDRVGNGKVLKIEVRAGIPRRVTLEKQLKDVEFEQSPAAR
jgi:hypothetical protein